MTDSADKKEPWVTRMALTTVIFAVGATLSTFKGSSYSTQSLVNQTLASDQWSFYQAKSMKQHLFELQDEQLQLQVLALDKANPAVKAYQDHIADNQRQIARYNQEKKDIEAKAKALEVQRDEAKKHNKPFGIAVLLLQVTILISSIAGLVKSQKVWWTALPFGLAGLLAFADGFIALF